MMSNTEWNETQLFFSGDEYFRAALDEIKTAQDEILVESYIFDYDTIGTRVIDALHQAKTRGVQVKVLVDGVGSFNWLNVLTEKAIAYGIDFRVYHPLPMSIKNLKKISWRNLRRLLLLFRKVNKRNHRKIIIIDRKTAFLGSLNISQTHSERISGLSAWRDTGLMVKGPQIQQLISSFHYVWGKSKFPLLQHGRAFLRPRRRIRTPYLKNALIRLNSTTTWRFFLFRDLKKRVRSATKRILITNAYFLPRRSLLRNLRKVARKGVYVGICVPGKLDSTPVHWATKHLYLRLIRDGVHVFEYQKSLLHAKTLVIDDWATVGSHNLNHRSIMHDLEVEAVLTDSASLNELAAQWDIDISHSKKISAEDLGNITFLDRLIARFVYWWRYWL